MQTGVAGSVGSVRTKHAQKKRAQCRPGDWRSADVTMQSTRRFAIAAMQVESNAPESSKVESQTR